MRCLSCEWKEESKRKRVSSAKGKREIFSKIDGGIRQACVDASRRRGKKKNVLPSLVSLPLSLTLALSLKSQVRRCFVSFKVLP